MIGSIHLQNFRNFKKRTLKFSEEVTVIIGPNASGKTNILEALCLLSTGKSFKTGLEAEMIKSGEDIANVKSSKLEVIITKGDNGWPRKKLLLNGISKRVIDFAGNFRIVLFGPWDMDLVTESPSIRRKFLDTVLSQVDREYRRSILSYEKGIRQRNRLLFRIREEGVSRSQLLFWDQLLIRAGNYITLKREEFIAYVNSHKSQVVNHYSIEYDRSIISEGRLEQYKNEEVAAATTLVGPHRDDFIFFDGKRDLAKYGSRGEQRMAVLWLKMAELSFIEKISEERPTLLLDDIFSELDHEHRDIVVKLAGNQQTIITTADEHLVKGFKNITKL